MARPAGGVYDDYNILAGIPDTFPNSIQAATIVLPERVDEAASTKYYATQLVTHLSHNYENRLKKATPLSAKLDEGLSSVTCSIINTDLDQRSKVYPHPDRYIGSTLSLYHILQTDTQSGYLLIFKGS